MAARGCEGLEVGLDPGASARVGAGNRQTTWNQRTPFAGTSRIRFCGCDLSPLRRAPRSSTVSAERDAAGAAGTPKPALRSLVWRRRPQPGTTCSPGEELAYLDRARARGRGRRRSPTSSTRACGKRSPHAGSRSSTRTRRDAWDAAARGEHVVVATGTAQRQDARLQPARARRARRATRRRGRSTSTRRRRSRRTRRAHSPSCASRRSAPAIYDGDTPSEQRWQIRKWSNLILTNPDMLHLGVLPHHDRWGDVLSNLAFVVIDEAHVYRGVFGSHVGQRAPPAATAGARLRRRAPLPARLGDDRQPRRAGRGAARRRGDGRGRRRSAESRTDDRALEPAARRRGARAAGERARRRLTPAWPSSSRAACARSRSARAARRRSWCTASPSSGSTTGSSPSACRPTVPATRPRSGARSSGGSSRASCSASPRRTRSSSESTSACSTPCISVGFPGTVASLRQQWGRAGRRDHGLAVLVASEDALDQYFMREPETLLGRRVEAAILDHANPRVLDGHVRSAAFEAPLDDADRELLGDAALERAAELPELKKTPAGYVWAGRDYPAARVPLRSTSPTRSPSSTPAAARCSAWSSASGRTRPCTRAPSTSTWARPTTCSSSTSTRGRRSSSPSPATGTRRRRRRRTPRSTRRSGRSSGSGSSSRSGESR